MGGRETLSPSIACEVTFCGTVWPQPLQKEAPGAISVPHPLQDGMLRVCDVLRVPTRSHVRRSILYSKVPFDSTKKVSFLALFIGGDAAPWRHDQEFEPI